MCQRIASVKIVPPAGMKKLAQAGLITCDYLRAFFQSTY